MKWIRPKPRSIADGNLFLAGINTAGPTPTARATEKNPDHCVHCAV
jgi:hypothetical protein